MRIYMIGFMGCGKTYWAKKMSKEFTLHLFDLDQYIEEKEGIKISELFKSKGEINFRERECHYLNEIISQQNNFIMASGGGTPCFFDNLNLMNNSGITIYLKAEPEYLLSNLLNERNQRPLIENFTEEELLFFIQRKLDERSTIYNTANYIVEANQFDTTIFAEIISKHV